jgi:type I restriction-modification system DNA methylase subunit
MPAPDSIKQLVERFDQHREAYRAGKYNETQLRNEFLNPFLEALGWDVLNKLGYSEENKHVIHEDSLEIEGAKKAPDYAFKIGKERKFFVEAKKPFVKIETNAEVAFQLKRYVWSAKLPLGILTDFEEFAVYECRSKPKVSDSVKTGRVMLLKYSDYIEKWDELVAIFSHEAVMTGKFDAFANTAAKKKGTAEIASAFLEEIEGWRNALATRIALRNKDRIHSELDLNYAVQMTIDRLIFLRICEERGYEPEFQLQEIARHENIYAELKKLFIKADNRYNSGLFHFKKEDGRGRADTFTSGLEIEDKALKEIIKDLYYPSPYVFSQIPANILGQIYEQFLGKVIRLTASGNAKVEEKPEVRKAGGVFYTPTFIVEYIVWYILKILLAGKTPVEAALLRLLDPACGSGTFLLVAYQYLLDWHLNWYLNNEFEKWSKGKHAVLVQVKDGWKLTVTKKKEILLNNIYGVDIDPQAVEVTKLSLLLKVIEDPGQLSLLDERILPDLGRNIQCGNSLIGNDYFEGQLTVSEEERAKVNAFDWQAAFPEVFAQGGFDGVFGNPPYIRMEAFKELKEYLRANYACHEERSDIYAYMIERAHKILKPGGLFGMIVSNKFLRANYGKPLRDFIQKNASVNRIVDFAGLPVFKGATVRTIVMLTSREKQKETFQYTPPLPFDVYSIVEAGRLTAENAIEETTCPVSSATLAKEVWSFAQQDADNLLNRLTEASTLLSKYCDGLICRGVVSGLTEAFVIDAETRAKIIKENPKATEIIKPFLNGRDIRRYVLEPKDIYLLYTYHDIAIGNYPVVENHLKPFKEQLKKRATKQEWYELQQPQFAYMKYFESPKIVFPDIATAPRFVLDEDGHYGSNTMYFIPRRDLYLLGLLNSKLAQFYFQKVCAGLEGKKETYLRFFGQYLEGFPVAKVDKTRHDKMVSLVERMLALHKSPKSTVNPQEADRLMREVESVDRAIDGLVYELYGLTEEEIKIVEE